MFNFLKSLASIVLIALLGYGLYSLATKHANDSTKTLRVAADNTTTVSGTVLTNNNGCLVPGGGTKCFLKLLVGTKEVYIIYNTNDNNAFCPNEGAAITGKSVREGANVKVYGYYRKDGDLDTVLTCPTKNYSIQTL